MKQSAWQTIMGIVLLGIVALISWQTGTLVTVQTQGAKADRKQPVVVIDAGHGGNDPGKVGIDGQLEKDINLKIAKRLKAYLEASDVKVILTRDRDVGLHGSGGSYKKMADMRKRCDIITEAAPDLVRSMCQEVRYFIIRTRRRANYLRCYCKNALIMLWEMPTGGWPSPMTIITFSFM